MGQDEASPLVGILLVVGLIALLLAVPLVVYGTGVLRRVIGRRAGAASARRGGCKPGAWSESAGRIATPTAAELDSQWDGGESGPTGGENHHG